MENESGCMLALVILKVLRDLNGHLQESSAMYIIDMSLKNTDLRLWHHLPPANELIACWNTKGCQHLYRHSVGSYISMVQHPIAKN